MRSPPGRSRPSSRPVAFAVFPGEIFQAPRSWAEKVYPNLIYFNEAERGGHFAAWESPRSSPRNSMRVQPLRDELDMSTNVDTATDVRPFHVDVSKDAIDDLRRRIEATRWPSKRLVDDRSQGVQLATLKALARWTTDYDFGRVESRLNALPQFTAEIDGLQIHFPMSARSTRTRCRCS